MDEEAGKRRHQDKGASMMQLTYLIARLIKQEQAEHVTNASYLSCAGSHKMFNGQCLESLEVVTRLP